MTSDKGLRHATAYRVWESGSTDWMFKMYGTSSDSDKLLSCNIRGFYISNYKK